MNINLPKAELRRLEGILKAKTRDVNHYLADGYEAAALHSSSIILEVNQACADMFGYTRNEMVFMNAWKLFSVDSVNNLMYHLVHKSEAPYQVEACKRNGSLFTVELKGRDFEIAGEPVRSVSLREITSSVV